MLNTSTASAQETSRCPENTPPTVEIPLRLHVPARYSGHCPMTVGIPLPHRLNLSLNTTSFESCHGEARYPCQISWQSDQSWFVASFMMPCCGPNANDSVTLRQCSHTAPSDAPVPISQAASAINIKLPAGLFKTGMHAERIAESPCLGPAGIQLRLKNESGAQRSFRWQQANVIEKGPIQSTVALKGKCGVLRADCRLSFYAASNLIRCEVTLHNPRRAKHPGGYWDLGDPGSVLFRELAIEVDCGPGAAKEIFWRETHTDKLQRTAGKRFQICQESSGGENWRSLNHVNRTGHVPLELRGYRVRTAEGEKSGLRASPIVTVSDGHQNISCAVEEFWQKFPTAIVCDKETLSIKLFPGEFPDLHELQAGEKCTRVVWLDFSSDKNPDTSRLAWVHQPPRVVAASEWVASTAQIAFFPAPHSEPRSELAVVADEALAGHRNFFAKREVVDEYGWLNFGDMWADHEEAYADDPKPVLSHYNNQYDLLHSLLVQYLLTGDHDWWLLADPLARHILDIDIYHTTRDKPAYNGGLFWHTAHYHSVGTATHRSMSVAMLGKKIPAPGTGPCNEHNYSNGLLLYHRLTGCSRARDAVLQFADWVIAMDDGDQHVLGLLSSEPTGLATRTTLPEFNGPGRGAGNSIHSLLNAWKLSGKQHYLQQAAALIRRTVHPRDDLARLRLGDPELRWSYTIYLQAIVRFLEDTKACADLASLREYSQSVLLHYARWMYEHETFSLDHPEKLEYPTETWAAQELRKGTTLQMAARFASASEAAKFRARGAAILDRAWQSLLSFPTRSYTRPLAVALQQGYLETYLRTDSTHASSPPVDESAWGNPVDFVPQKEVLRKAFKQPRSLLRMMPRILNPIRWQRVLRQTWLAEQVRRLVD